MRIDIVIEDFDRNIDPGVMQTGTDWAVAERDGRKVVSIHSGVSMVRFTQLLIDLLTPAERAEAVYHEPAVV